jgi:hypothetical protein
MPLGIYHHASPGYLAPYVASKPVADTWTNEFIAFTNGYLAKAALWLRAIGLTPVPPP